MKHQRSVSYFSRAARLLRQSLTAWFVFIATALTLTYAPHSSAQKLPDPLPSAQPRVAVPADSPIKSASPSPSSSGKTPGGSVALRCGTAAGGMFPSPPLSNLCAEGSVVTVPVAALGATQYQWTCGNPPPVAGLLNLPNLVQPSVCTANKKYNGQCGSANGVVSAAAPTANLCALGTATTPTLTGSNYTWSCTGVMPATGATVASCSAPAPSIVQAVSETISSTAGTEGSSNVRANDTASPGSSYSLAAGSTCSPVSVSALGVVSYTAPAAGQSCVVNYTVCNSGQCSTAALTVTSAPPPPPLVQAVNDSVSAAAGTEGSINVRANDTAPPGASYSLAAGSTCSPVSISALGMVIYIAPAAGQSCVVNYTVCISGQCSTGTLTVTGTAPPVPTYTIGVNVSGLPSGSNVVLQNNGGNNLTVAVNGAATFSNVVASAYAVTVLAQPTAANCVVTGGTGTASANVNNISVACTASRFSLVPKASSGFYDVTECVKDNVTGLIWEGKTAGGVRAGGNTHTNYDNASQAQKWDPSAGTVYPTLSQINAITNSIGYSNTVNVMGLCGGGSWRIPTHSELSGLYVAAGGVASAAMAAWLPHTVTAVIGNYLTNSTCGGGAIYFCVINFSNGSTQTGQRSDYFSFPIRLVSSGP